MASASNPTYSVYIVASGTKYNLTSAIVSIDTSEQKKQIAQSVRLELMNIWVGGTWLSDLINVRDRVFIYANDGTRNDEIFRGYVWTRNYLSAASERTLSLKCYDHLIYLQESEESEYFAPGKTTEDVFSYICDKWGVKLEYNYTSITHQKLALRGNLTDIFTADLLDLAKDRSGKEYVILSTKDVMQVVEVGKNSTVYSIVAGSNAVRTNRECTMDGMITKVIILGKADEDDREPIEATISGDTKKYGTLQKILRRDENTTPAQATKEAQNIVDEQGKPKWEYEIQCTDIPWIRKGDKVYVKAGDINGKYLIATGVERSITNKTKQLTLTCVDVA